jgi:AcrR family transcriptional regulator
LEPRAKLLEQVIAELDRNGLGERSLRDLAAAVGTSHRMLIHHFGSRAGLLLAVVDEVERAERARAVDATSSQRDPATTMRDSWKRLADRSFSGRERLFFECYARALQGEEPFAQMLPGAVEEWVDAITAAQEETGVPRRTARTTSRLGLALMRGLLLDLLATGDRRATDEALEAFVALFEARAEGAAGDAAAAPPRVRRPVAPAGSVRRAPRRP